MIRRTTATLITTITAFTRADSRMPITSSAVAAVEIRIAGRLKSAVTVRAIGQHDGRARGGAEERWKRDPEVGEKGDDVAGPPHRHRGGAKRVLEHQIPADDPGDELTERRVSIGVR